MKKLIFLLMTCGMHVCSFPQTEIAGKNIISSDKYEITPIKGLKKGMGRLNLNFPEGVEWSVDVYNASSKFITNFSIIDQRNFGDKKNYQDLAAGLYHFKVNTVLVENVPIEEGKETKLRTGVLDITNAGNWELRSEDKKKYLTSGNKAKKIALPVGKYMLVEGNRTQQVMVSEELNPVLNPTVLETNQWVAKPMNNSNTSLGKIPTGRLKLNFGDSMSRGISGLFIQGPGGYYKSISAEGTESHIDLTPGIYKITWNGTNTIYNVRVVKDHETVLKYGVFIVQAESKWFMGVGPPSSNHCGPKKFALPVGLGIALWPMGTYVADFIQTFGPIQNGSVEYARIGYLQVSSYISIQDGGCSSSLGPGDIPLIPGKYTVIHGAITSEVTIKAGETTVLQ